MTAAVRLARPPLRWYRDPVGCLHTTLATVLLHAGRAPLPALGAHWEFRYRPGDARSEEFYYPCRYDGDPARSIAPGAGITSRWRQAPDGDGAALGAIADHLAAGGLPIVAVDNYHLPFRPAYRDVHAAHLVVVYGVDRDQVYVQDSVPPAFRGPIDAAHLLRAWSSPNPAGDRDTFFAASPIARRWLAVSVGPPPPVLDRDRLAAALRENLRRFADHADGLWWCGSAGLDRFLAHLLATPAAIDDVYPFGWAVQAQAYLHAELLRTCAQDWRVPELAEAARAVESVAYAWTGLRMTAAHRRHDPPGAVPELSRHAGRVRRGYDAALAALAGAERALSAATPAPPARAAAAVTTARAA